MEITMQYTIINEAPMAEHRRVLGIDNWQVKEEPDYIEVVVKSWEMK